MESQFRLLNYDEIKNRIHLSSLYIQLCIFGAKLNEK